MRNREELDGMMMLLRAMSGESNVIENMEAEGQQVSISRTQMAKEMCPSREDWEQLGFTFTDIEGDSQLCRATLPAGWSMNATERSMRINILDQNGMQRG